jgi:hypothetical protein
MSDGRIAIEAWVIAALFPRQRAPEQIPDGAAWLVEKKKLRRSLKDGKPWKELHRYREFGAGVAQSLPRVRRSCAEAERTSRAIELRRAALEDRRGASR